MAQDNSSDIQVYSPIARFFHWAVALLILIQVPIAFYMTYRGYEMPFVNEQGEAKKGVFDAITGAFYSSHKLIGLIILALVVARLAYRLLHGAPKSDASLAGWQKGLSHFNHWALYLLLIAVPIGGYIGISYYGALDIFGVNLPAVTAKDEKFSEEVFEWHETGAFILLGLIALHILATIYHRFIKRDRVVERMLPKRTV